MGLIQEIKFLWHLRETWTKIKEAEKMNSTTVTPGWKTTEFWLTVLTNIITIAGSLQGIVPAQTAAIITAVANGVYGILRTITKSNSPSTVEPLPTTPK